MTGEQWRAEVIADDSGIWCANGLIFGSRDEALEYVRNLAGRWTLVRMWRVVPVTTATRQAYEPGSEDGAW